MAMTPNEIEGYVLLMAKHRVARLQTPEGLQLEMSPLGFQIPMDPDVKVTPAKVGAEHGNPTDEELLEWSTGLPLPDIHSRPPEEPK